MKHVFVLVVAALGACNKPDTAATAPEAAAEAPKVPFTGTLTGERIMASKGLVQPLDPWDGAKAKLEAQMGNATLVKDKQHTWAVSQGDDCWYVQVEKQDDGKVGAVTYPMKVSKGGPLVNWDDCLTGAGVRKDAVEDPNAPGPPTDGKAITVVELRNGAMKARSKWGTAKVTVHGLYLGVTNMESNGVASANVAITAAKADLTNVVHCSLADPTTAPTKTMQYDPITVSGSVRVSDMLTGGGDRLVDVGLEACSIIATKK